MKSLTADYIKSKRRNLGLTQREFADALGLGRDGQRQIRAWEAGEHAPGPATARKIRQYQDVPPYVQKGKTDFTFIDLFAGIGGIRLAFQEEKGRCVATSEWDKFAQKTYRLNFGEMPLGDITGIAARDLPDHDILLAGFPCQPFSQAGLKKGFFDTRGTLFFDIQRILTEKRPAAFLLENVKQLRGHNGGNTLKTILTILRGHTTGVRQQREMLKGVEIGAEARATLLTPLNYWVDYRILRARDFGVPQNRERIFIVGFDRDRFPAGFDFDKAFSFPEGAGVETRVGDILEKRVDPKYTISDRLWQGHQRRRREHRDKGNGFGYSLFHAGSEYANTISARYYKDGSEILIRQARTNPRKLTPRECARLQGFPDDFLIPVSDAQAYRQFGNSVAVPVVRALAKEMKKTLQLGKLLRTKGRS